MLTRQNQKVVKDLHYAEKRRKALRIQSKRIIKKVQMDRKHIIAELQDAEDECYDLKILNEQLMIENRMHENISKIYKTDLNQVGACLTGMTVCLMLSTTMPVYNPQMVVCISISEKLCI